MRKSDLVGAQQESQIWSSKTHSSALCSTLCCTQMVIETCGQRRKKIQSNISLSQSHQLAND